MKKRILLGLFFIYFSVFLSAHESRPLYIQITETAPNIYAVKVNIPNSVTENNLPLILFPAGFTEEIAFKTLRTTPAGYLETTQFKGITASIKGTIFYIEFPQFNPSITSIVQIELQNEAPQTLVIGPNKNQFIIPTDPSKWTVIQQYCVLGIAHIWAGIDHLLFLVCLLFITGFTRKLFWTITGFTVAHSITLILSTLGWVNLPIKPIEACIALSIIFLCYEIIHHHNTKSSLTYQYPVAVSSSFGLLHGLGFASVLSAIGLPTKSKLTALLCFNIGVEIGQIIFIAMFFIIVAVGRNIAKKLLPNSQPALFKIGIYGIGILASYWFFERLF